MTTCKNCQLTLSDNDSFCNACGAKVIDRRITMKTLLTEFATAFFSIDSSKPVRTFFHLFSKPEVVIGGYIDGVRKKYIHAFGYFTIAVTLSSFFFFVFLKWFPDALNYQSSMFSANAEQAKMSADINKSIFEYTSLIFFLTIPFLAAISRLVFLKNKKYNYAEHLIIALYAYSHVSILVTLLYLMTVWYFPVFQVITIAALPIQVIFYGYVLKRLYGLSVLQILLKTLLFGLILIPLLFITMLIIGIIMYAGGYMDGMIEAQKAAAQQKIGYMASSVINWTS